MITLPSNAGTVRYKYYGDEFVPFDELDGLWQSIAEEFARQLRDEGEPQLSVAALAAEYARRHRAAPTEDHWLYGWMDYESSRLLYHYTSAERLLDIMSSGALRMSPLTAMRDPREFRDWELATLVEHGSSIDVSAVTNAARQLRRCTKIVCFGQDQLPTDEPDPLFSKIMDPHKGKGFLRPRMWEQYGGGHTGVCLIFDRHAVDDTFKAHLSSFVDDPVLPAPCIFNGVVAYEDDYSHRTHAGGLGLIRDGYSLADWVTSEIWLSESFLTKDVDWMTEHEYRWGLMTATPGHIDVPLESGCLLGLVVGLDWKPAWTPVVEMFARQFAITANVAAVEWEGQGLGYRLVDVATPA